MTPTCDDDLSENHSGQNLLNTGVELEPQCVTKAGKHTIYFLRVSGSSSIPTYVHNSCSCTQNAIIVMALQGTTIGACSTLTRYRGCQFVVEAAQATVPFLH